MSYELDAALAKADEPAELHVHPSFFAQVIRFFPLCEEQRFLGRE